MDWPLLYRLNLESQFELYSTGGVSPEGPIREDFGMPSVLAYHRPVSLKEAIELASQPNAIVVGGGTDAVPSILKQGGDGVQIVDLQELDFDKISVLKESGDKQVTIGSMTRISEIETAVEIPEILRNLARRELPSALRNQATLGGTIALADAESVLLAGLLAFAAEIEINGETWIDLDEYLQTKLAKEIITSIRITTGEEDLLTSFQSVSRTPMDTPIVSAAATKSNGGKIRVAFTGVGDTPILVRAKNELKALKPKEDFRGSVAYRSHLASVLYQRVMMEISQ